jgi:hypothetical protein
MEMRELFRDPPAAFRGKPFWAWNGKLEEGELRRQLGVFKTMGLGGAFMHSRVGLATAYLSEEWFRLVAACVDECRTLKMEAWAYDEDRWPSGAAGGLVTKDPRFRMRSLEAAVIDAAGYQPAPDVRGVYAAHVDGGAATGVRKVSPPAVAKEGERLIVIRESVSEPSPWYNDQTYLDTMSAPAVKRFLEVTHEAYARAVGDAFGTVMPGIFTDEPNYHHWGSPASVP